MKPTDRSLHATCASVMLVEVAEGLCSQSPFYDTLMSIQFQRTGLDVC